MRSLPVLAGYAPPIFIGMNGALWLSCGLNFLLSAGTVVLRSPVTAVDYSFFCFVQQFQNYSSRKNSGHQRRFPFDGLKPCLLNLYFLFSV